MKSIKSLVLNAPLLFIILMMVPFSGLQAQDAGTSEILELLESDKKKKTASDGEDSGYKSFVQNEYMSVTKQLSELRFDEKQDIFFSDLQKKRMETDFFTKTGFFTILNGIWEV